MILKIYETLEKSKKLHKTGQFAPRLFLIANRSFNIKSFLLAYYHLQQKRRSFSDTGLSGNYLPGLPRDLLNIET